MVGVIYEDAEILKYGRDCHVMGNGTVTAGAAFVDNPDVRVDIIVVRKDYKPLRVSSSIIVPEGHETDIPTSELPASTVMKAGNFLNKCGVSSSGKENKNIFLR
jgi:hypothetical protein